MPVDVHEELLDGAIHHAVRLERYKASVVREIARLLDSSLADVEDILVRRLDRVLESGDYGPEVTKRVLALVEEVGAVRADAVEAVDRLLRDEMAGLAGHEAAWTVAALQPVVEVDLGVVTPTAELLHSAVFERPFNGHVLGDWVRGIVPADLDRMQRAVQMGVVEGKTVREVTRAIVGPEGTMAKTTRGAQALARTAINHTVTQAREETYRANDDLVEGVRWVATLDSRTTMLCAGRDGTVYRVGEGPRPPAHWACRSTTIPVIPGVRLVSQRPSVGPGGEVAQVPAKTTYAGWLRRQPASFQDEVLGPARGRLFREGKVSLDGFVDDSGKVLTLDQLRKADGR